MIRRDFLLATTATAVLAALPASASSGPQVGQPAPDFTATDSDGKQVRLADLRGKTVVLEWTNHDCPYVRKHYGSANMQNLQKQATGAGVVWLSIISSAPGKQGYVNGLEANDLTAKRGAAPTAVLLDPTSKIAGAYGARVTPHMYIVDAKGTLVYMGGIDDIYSADPADIPKAKNFVRVALEEIAAGKPVSQPITRAYGCTVKYAT